MPAKKEKKELSFEEAVAELESIVEKMEAGDLGLEESLAYFEKGNELSKFCQEKLTKASKRIEKLVKTSDSEASWVEDEEDDDEDE